MFNMVNKNGYGIIHHMDEHTKILLNPVESFKHIISQQRRWIKGVFEGNLSTKILVVGLIAAASAFSLFTIYLMLSEPMIGVPLALSKLVVDTLMYGLYGRKTKIRGLVVLSPFSFLYTLLVFIVLPATFIFRPNIAWMGDGYTVTYD